MQIVKSDANPNFSLNNIIEIKKKLLSWSYKNMLMNLLKSIQKMLILQLKAINLYLVISPSNLLLASKMEIHQPFMIPKISLSFSITAACSVNLVVEVSSPNLLKKEITLRIKDQAKDSVSQENIKINSQDLETPSLLHLPNTLTFKVPVEEIQEKMKKVFNAMMIV